MMSIIWSMVIIIIMLTMILVTIMVMCGPAGTYIMILVNNDVNLMTFVNYHDVQVMVAAETSCPLRDYIEADCKNLVGLVSRMKDRWGWSDHDVDDYGDHDLVRHWIWNTIVSKMKGRYIGLDRRVNLKGEWMTKSTQLEPAFLFNFQTSSQLFAQKVTSKRRQRKATYF